MAQATLPGLLSVLRPVVVRTRSCRLHRLTPHCERFARIGEWNPVRGRPVSGAIWRRCPVWFYIWVMGGA